MLCFIFFRLNYRNIFKDATNINTAEFDKSKDLNSTGNNILPFKNHSFSLNPNVCSLPEIQSIGHKTRELKRDCVFEKEWGYLEQNIWYFIPEVKTSLHLYKCSYQAVTIIDDFSFTFNPNKKIVLNDAQLILDEVFEVKCIENGRKTVGYKRLFVQIVKKNVKQISNLVDDRLSSLNIVLMSFDSVSRVSWLERLKRTNKFIFDEMKFDLLKGYNIIGDGTPAGSLKNPYLFNFLK